MDTNFSSVIGPTFETALDYLCLAPGCSVDNSPGVKVGFVALEIIITTAIGVMTYLHFSGRLAKRDVSVVSNAPETKTDNVKGGPSKRDQFAKLKDRKMLTSTTDLTRIASSQSFLTQKESSSHSVDPQIQESISNKIETRRSLISMQAAESASSSAETIENVAMTFAKNEVKDIRERGIPVPIVGSGIQPVNPDIAYLIDIKKIYRTALFNAVLRENKNLSDPEVVFLFDSYVKLAYAISTLILEDLPALSKKIAAPSIEDLLLQRDTYAYSRVLELAAAYHWIRSKFNPQKGGEKDIPLSYANQFYEKGKVQNDWNSLYNSNSKHLKAVAPAMDPERHRQHINWTKPDNGIDSFESLPDDLPFD